MSTTILAAILVFIYKLFDGAFSTLKTISLYKNKYFLASLYSTAGTLFYTIAIVKIAQADNSLSLVAIALATFLGTYVPGKALNHLEGDQLFIYEITADTMDNGQLFADGLRKENIPVRTTKTYDKDLQKTLAIKVYSQSKAVSKFIEDSMPEDFKWTVYNQVRS